MFPVKITSAAQVIISSSSAVSVCFFDDIVFLFLYSNRWEQCFRDAIASKGKKDNKFQIV
jgi:hypothetical protein